MAFVLKFAKTIRNNWKKSVFFTAVAIYGVKYATRKHNDEQIRRVYCEEAKHYGNHKIALFQRPKKIYVFLNPAAQGNNARKLFEKNAAPILHLAGLEVVLVKTEYESQAKQFMSVIEVEDAHSIVVAGGDGTLSEVVTGFLRKSNRSFERSVPVGIIPLGNNNRFARKWFGYGKEKNEVETIADAAMAVVKGKTKPVDVLSIKGDDGKTTYALSGLEIGAYRDAVARKNKYWYFGPLKFRWTYIRTIMKDWPPTIKGKLQYIPADADIVAKKPKETKVENSESAGGWSWLSLFYRSRPVSKVEDIDDDVDIEDLVDSDAELTRDIDTVEFTLMSSLYCEKTDMDGCPPVKHVDVGLGPSSPSRTDLLQEGWGRINSDILQLGTKTNEQISARYIKFVPDVRDGAEELWFTIDGEHYEAKPIEIQVLKNRLKFYCLDTS